MEKKKPERKPVIDLKKLGDILQKKRAEEDLSQEDVRVKTGVSKATISRIENNITIPDTETIERLLPFLGASFTDISLDQISYEADDNLSRTHESLKPSIDEYGEGQSAHRIPYFEGAHLGSPALVNNEPDRYWNLHEELILRPQETFIVRVFGESMIDANIFDQDMLIIERVKHSEEVRNDDIILANVRGAFSVRKFYKNKSTIELRSANVAQKSKYQSIFVIPKDEFDHRRVEELKNAHGANITVVPSNEFYLWGLVKHLIRRF